MKINKKALALILAIAMLAAFIPPSAMAAVYSAATVIVQPTMVFDFVYSNYDGTVTCVKNSFASKEIRDAKTGAVVTSGGDYTAEYFDELRQIFKDGYVGLADPYGNVILPAVYQGMVFADRAKDTFYYWVIQNDKYGIISITYSDLDGDVNGDGKVDSLDASLVLQCDAGLIEFKINVNAAADVNGDGKTDSLDASLILQYDAGLIKEFPSVPKDYITSPGKVNYALNATYSLLKNGVEEAPSRIYLGYEGGNTVWSDVECKKLNDGRVAMGSELNFSSAALEDVTVQLVGTNALYSYTFTLDNFYGDIKNIVWRNVRDGVENGNNRGFYKNPMIYVSDDGVRWGEKLAGTLSKVEVEGAPEIKSNYNWDEMNVETFDFTFALSRAAKGKFVKICISTPVYVLQLDEIEIWN